MFDPHAHCGHCGARFQDAAWPRRCDNCDRPSFRNTAPVVVVLAPVDDGLLVIQRGIQPHRGEWALPGGFIDYGETWQRAAVRELSEETGVVVPADDARMHAVHSTPIGTHLLVFARVPTIAAAALSVFEPNDEVSAIEVIHAPRALAFPLHTQVCTAFFDRG